MHPDSFILLIFFLPCATDESELNSATQANSSPYDFSLCSCQNDPMRSSYCSVTKFSFFSVHRKAIISFKSEWNPSEVPCSSAVFLARHLSP